MPRPTKLGPSQNMPGRLLSTRVTENNNACLRNSRPITANRDEGMFDWLSTSPIGAQLCDDLVQWGYGAVLRVACRMLMRTHSSGKKLPV